MKTKLTTAIIFIVTLCQAQPTIKEQIFSKSNIIHVGKRGYIEKDKFLHSTAGAFVGSSVYMYSYYKTDKMFLSAALSILSAFVVGEIKEIHDRNNGGKFSNDDLAATTMGGVTGVFTKIIQIDVQHKNKMLTDKAYREQFENLR